MKTAVICSNELKKFKTFSAGFFISTSKKTRDKVYDLSDNKIEELINYISQSSKIESFIRSKIGNFKESKEKQIQAIAYSKFAHAQSESAP